MPTNTHQPYKPITILGHGLRSATNMYLIVVDDALGILSNGRMRLLYNDALRLLFNAACAVQLTDHFVSFLFPSPVVYKKILAFCRFNYVMDLTH